MCGCHILWCTIYCLNYFCTWEVNLPKSQAKFSIQSMLFLCGLPALMISAIAGRVVLSLLEPLELISCIKLKWYMNLNIWPAKLVFPAMIWQYHFPNRVIHHWKESFSSDHLHGFLYWFNTCIKSWMDVSPVPQVHLVSIL